MKFQSLSTTDSQQLRLEVPASFVVKVAVVLGAIGAIATVQPGWFAAKAAASEVQSVTTKALPAPGSAADLGGVVEVNCDQLGQMMEIPPQACFTGPLVDFETPRKVAEVEINKTVQKFIEGQRRNPSPAGPVFVISDNFYVAQAVTFHRFSLPR